ncbi:hypothetical protein SMACR_05262 [Sordaria macrospora]|uniref:WGS project CABT00000000 data, contig 2.8 n=2 Tax=Sordaria macrospora TaxID=5147 RepID=F7VUX8_SORMK|nr:uncharacterized protein SMAC_05262 [Sordaria macrospora k-hell]KAA8632653.1 hypothetical protein SMACR_05262 [Sordaria macrospora]WPJ57374.1 hypothetical protein SMAC4_05262 [Sordaria macrospora]CCC09324.1 unnamed protein product [Sordaria macrospora k-hell]
MNTTAALRTILFLASVLTASASPDSGAPDLPPPSLEAPSLQVHNELNFAFNNNLPRQISTGQELQPFFTANFLGGQSPQPIVFSGDAKRSFEVGGDTFVSLLSFSFFLVFSSPAFFVTLAPLLLLRASRTLALHLHVKLC